MPGCTARVEVSCKETETEGSIGIHLSRFLERVQLRVKVAVHFGRVVLIAASHCLFRASDRLDLHGSRASVGAACGTKRW